MGYEQCSYLCLGVGLQSQQAAHLLALGLDDSCTHVVLRVGIHVLQQSRSQSQQLQNVRTTSTTSAGHQDDHHTHTHMHAESSMWTHLGLQDFSVHAVVGFEDLLGFLLRPGGA